jgi:EAL domain-containing protein (putative c-di-GMP-specific phosphodiesterase class I)
MFNVSSAVPSLIILIMFLACYFSVPRIPILTNRLYIRILLIDLLTSVMNILSAEANRKFPAYNYYLTYALATAFLIMLIIRSYMFFAYSASLVNLNHYNSRIFAWIMRTPLMISILIIASSYRTGACFSIGKEGYAPGRFMYIVYVCTFFYVAVSILAVFIHRHNLSDKREFLSAISFNIILVIGASIVLFDQTSLLIDSFCLMAIIIIYIAFENPDFYIEKRTGLFNQNALNDYIQEMRYKKQFLIFAFVIKNYQDIREIYGVSNMDQGIRLIGQHLKSTYPDITFFYIKEGRFISVAAADTDANRLCAELRARFDKPWHTKKTDLYLSIAFAKLTPETEIKSVDLSISSVISALNRASKAEDGLCAIVCENDIKDYIKEISVKKILELTVEENLVEVFFQPIVEAKNFRVIGAEALARIRDRDGKYVSPGDFIPIAEKNGCITTLGEQIFDKTCKFIKESSLDSIGLSWINVNLSPMQFFVNDLASSYVEILKKNDLDFNIIHLEITEEAMVSQSFLLKQMESMTDKGFQFVLDDYGTGYSNLARLQKCPFINIKIDMSLVWAYCKEPNLLLPSMISGFKSMGFTVTAEGIETKEMAEAMINLGCDYLQGNYFSRPLPMKDFTNAFAIFA